MLYLRNQPPNLARYLPQFLQEDGHFKATLAACSTEHEKYRLLLDEITNQFYIETATWGLTDWERILDLRPDAGDNYEQRRNRILLKLQGKQTSTLDFMRALVLRYCKEGTQASIIENDMPYTFKVDVSQGSVLYAKDLLEALDTYKPAHLSYKIALRWRLELTENEAIHYGLIDACMGKKTVKIPTPPETILQSWAGVGHIVIGRKCYNLARPETVETRTTIGIYQMRTGHIIIGGYK